MTKSFSSVKGRGKLQQICKTWGQIFSSNEHHLHITKAPNLHFHFIFLSCYIRWKVYHFFEILIRTGTEQVWSKIAYTQFPTESKN